MMRIRMRVESITQNNSGATIKFVVGEGSGNAVMRSVSPLTAEQFSVGQEVDVDFHPINPGPAEEGDPIGAG